MKNRQYQNRVNNAQGHIFEGGILAACGAYERAGRAVIGKTPEPFRVTNKKECGIFEGRFTAPAQPDFQGTLAGGQSIVFEAKYTTTDRIGQDVLTKTQAEQLQFHYDLGAVAAICAGIQDKFFFIPWTVWRDMKARFGRKYIKAEDVEQYRVRYAMAILFLDYIHQK